MAKVEKRGSKWVVVNSGNGVLVGRPNTFSTRAAAQRRARQCNPRKGCKN